jgi:hypothetical protein
VIVNFLVAALLKLKGLVTLIVYLIHYFIPNIIVFHVINIKKLVRYFNLFTTSSRSSVYFILVICLVDCVHLTVFSIFHYYSI